MHAAMTAFQDALLSWSEREGWRDLPWRRTRDPWSVLVSELMLQQTQVPRVVPKYDAFLRRFPTPAACAAAPVGDVVRMWAGLGYNRRAVNLHRAAQVCVDDYGGALPDTLVDLLALPGVGPYTARAVLAFAHEQDVAVLDTNAARVVARVRGRTFALADAQSEADALVPEGRGWRWNQAILDLGASVCTKRVPRCERCPVTRSCAWFATGRSTADPAEGSGGTSGRQSAFAGSDRQGRGRLVDALRLGPLPLEHVAATAGWPDDPHRADRIAASLVADGLAEVCPDSRVLRLP
ncbi:MAG TPA: A/G-specific adenine glycosylase [Acidimicrobiales bacterium]